jgi:hypothetical protein
VSGSSTALASLEPSFHQDLNGDGLIGLPALPTTVIEAAGSTSLVEAGSNYFLYSNSSGTGPELKSAGAPVVAGQTSGWTPIGTEQTASGYEVAWKLAGAVDQYAVWSADRSGNFITNMIGVVPGSSAALESLEPSLHQDLNGDGVIGVPAATVPAAAQKASGGNPGLDVAHLLGGQGSAGWQFDFTSYSGSGGTSEPEGSLSGSKLPVAPSNDAQAVQLHQMLQAADAYHEILAGHDNINLANVADLLAGHFIIH